MLASEEYFIGHVHILEIEKSHYQEHFYGVEFIQLLVDLQGFG